MVLPSIWELLIPNLNTTTILGTLLIVFGIFLMTGFTLIGLPQLRTLGFLIILGGIIIVWGFSMIADILQTTEGKTWFFGIVSIAFAGFLLFYQPKKKKKVKRK